MAERPDLIVTDLRIWDATGNSMIAMIDRCAPLSGIPVIIVTGVTKDELAKAGIAKEVPIVSKPVDFDKLAAEVNKVAQKLDGTLH
jgi:response regulator RpfG family c-di-GMP phosphodiesterase